MERLRPGALLGAVGQDEQRRLGGEVARLEADVQQARSLVLWLAGQFPVMLPVLYEMLEKIEYHWLDELPVFPAPAPGDVAAGTADGAQA